MFEIHRVETLEQAQSLADFLWNYTDAVALDTETLGCNPKVESPVGRARIWCMSLAWGPTDGSKATQAAFVPVEYLAPFVDWLRSSRPKIGTNLYGFDLHVFENANIRVGGIVGDTAVMSRLLDPTPGIHGLKERGEKLGYTVLEYKDVTTVRKAVPGKPRTYKRNRVAWDECDGQDLVRVCYTAGTEVVPFTYKNVQLPLDELWAGYPAKREQIVKYACQDAVMSLADYRVLSSELEAKPW